jgi:hypothetical protein
MSQDLVTLYFERDLNAQERDALEALLSSDPEAADRMAALAAQAYSETGLPLPLSKKEKRRRWLLIGIGVSALLIGLGWWLFSNPKQCAQALPSLPALDEPALPLEKPVAKASHASARPTRLDVERLSLSGSPVLLVKVHMGLSGPATLSVEGPSVRETLYQGNLDSGSHRFEWHSQKTGHYRLVLNTREKEYERWVWVDKR